VSLSVKAGKSYVMISVASTEATSLDIAQMGSLAGAARQPYNNASVLKQPSVWTETTCRGEG